MYGIWIALSCTADRARAAVRNTVRNEAGALTLEWIIIAAALVGAGAALGAFGSLLPLSRLLRA